MVKNLLNFLILFFLFSSISFADINARTEAQILQKIQNEFGRDLTHAPFFLRFSFEKEFSKSWSQSDYAQRKAFLTQYEKDLIADRLKERTQAKIAADKEKNRLIEKKNEQRVLRDRMRQQLDLDKEEAEEVKDRKKELQTDVHEEQRELQDMKRLATKGT